MMTLEKEHHYGIVLILDPENSEGASVSAVSLSQCQANDLADRLRSKRPLKEWSLYSMLKSTFPTSQGIK